MTLQDIAPLKDPAERVTLPERALYERGLTLLRQGAFSGVELTPVPFKLVMHWHDEKPVSVTVVEERPQGPLKFSCSRCLESGRQARTCEHQWATFVLLWRSLAQEPDELDEPQLVQLAGALGELVEGGNPADSPYAGVVLDSVSLFLAEPPQLGGPAVGELLDLDFGKYKFFEFAKKPGAGEPAERELLSPRLWNLPEIFRKKVSGFSGSQLHEAAKINRLAGILRYNFSNGMQIGVKEILRHPLQKKVPGELFPQPKAATPPAQAPWPLVLEVESTFVSRELQEIEEIMQELLARVAERQRRRQLEVFLQSDSVPGRALALTSIEFEPAREVDWRVEFRERKGDLLSEFRLVCFRKRPLQFFESFAVEPVDGVLIVHPWRKELKALDQRLARIFDGAALAERKMPGVELTSEGDAKVLLKYLRARAIPVKIEGETRVLAPHRSLSGIHLEDGGVFFLQHEARAEGHKDLVRRGWTARAEIYLQTLADGLPFLLNVEPRELASRQRNKRDWDLKLLKHQGVLHYVMFETLSLHFEGRLSDGAVVTPEQLFTALHARVQALLIAGSGGAFVRDVPLTELCSKPVLAAFEDFVKSVLGAAEAAEAFYSETGEIVLEGVVGRELRLIHALIRKAVEMSGGEIFRRSRGVVLARAEGHVYKFPSIGGVPAAQEILESLQGLIPHGFKLFYKGQALHELAEDEFRVDFVLKTESDARFFNWFELNPRFFLRGEEVDSDKFLSLGGGGVVEYDGKLFLVPRAQMPSLRRLESFWQKLQSGKTEATRKQGRDKVYQLPRNQTLELLALRASGVAIRGDHDWNRICEFYDRLGSENRALKVPESTKGELKPYQARGVQWLQDLYELRMGALLADDMGLGKTLQTLSFLDLLRVREELGPVLVVVPSSLIYNWRSEIEKFTPELPVAVFTNRERDEILKRVGVGENLVVIATYGLLMEHEAELAQYKWRVLVFDEAQNLKNITAKRTSAARALTAQFKICLTGTPMENHYGEFYSLVDILVPGSLGRREDFRRRFVNTEMVTREELDDLKLKIKPLLLRRTKKEIQDQLPEKQETKVSIAFEDRQKEIYRDIALSYNQRVQETMASQGEASVQLQMLTALLRLRQACSDPAALPNVKYDKVPPKLETLLESLEEIIESGESALVFTQFLQTLEHTAAILKRAQIPVFVLHGGIPTKQRQKVLEDFNRVPGGAVLLMTLKTGGVGLNLTKASYVFHLEPWWNPSVENQATDRAHRLGQNRAVQVFRYIMHESLEEKIELLKDRKDRKFHSLFSATEGEPEVGAGGSALSKADFDLLLGIRED